MSFFSSRRAKVKKTDIKEKARGKEKHSAGFEDRRSRPMPKPPDNAPQFVKDQYQALLINAGETRKHLDILRHTRGQRDVGTIKVPVHLQSGEPLDPTYRDRSGALVRPEKRGDARADVRPAED